MWWLYLIPLIAVLAALVLLGAVLFARFVLRPPGPQVLELIGEETRTSPAVASALAELESSLAEIGLRRLGRLRIRSAAHVTAYATALASEDGVVTVQGVLHAVRLGDRERVVSRCLEFSTRLGQGAVLVTSNAARHALTDRLVSYWRFPLCRDAAALARIHRAVIAADGRTPTPLPDGASAWVSRLMEDGEQTWRALEDAGMVRRLPAGGWRYTWRFAVAEAAGSIWPISRLREGQDRKEARALLETVWLAALWKTG